VNNIIKRTLTGIIFVTVLFGCIFIHQYTFFLLFLAICIAAVNEYYSLIKEKIAAQRCMGSITAASIFTASYVHVNYQDARFFTIPLALSFLTFIVELYRKKDKPFDNIAHTLLGVFYTAIPFSLINYIIFWGGDTYMPLILAAIFILIWSNDTFAFIWGVSFGKHRLFERISPKKSWEGSIGGGLTTIGIAYLISIYIPQIETIDWLCMAAIIVVTGSLGDLTESLLKRSLKIKDSGNILPGHGGILDRFDAFIMAIPFIFVYMIFKC
jgi:phosphatidate cytidylyltransferase